MLALAALPEQAISVNERTNTPVVALDFIGLLLVEPIPYVAGRRHFHNDTA
jgi:hypothetical protein